MMLRRWPLTTLFAISLLFTPSAHAETLACGVYVDADSGARLEVLDIERARIVREGMAPSAQIHRRDGKTLRLYDIDEGYSPDDYTVSADGRTVTGVDPAFRKTFVLESIAACATARPAVPGTCAADIDACIASADLATDAMLQRYCDEGMPFACVKAIDRERQRAEHPEAYAGEDAAPPPECREGTPTFSAEACDTAIAKLLGSALAEVATSMYADDVPLPQSNLDGLPALCARHGSAKICARVAEELWIGGRYAQSRDALRIGCDRGGDPEACKQVAPLADLRDAQLQAVPATALPCGRYVADTGLMSELDFGDRGIVTGFGGDLRARLEAGLVRIRHDKGGDFVLQRIGDDRLLGIDDWNRYAVYRRDGGATSCAAPVVFVEKPLVEDCPQPGKETAAACCERGSLHGCNIAGHQRALGGAWAEAKPFYLKVCAAGVRIGCENLTQVFARGGDETVPEELDRLCGKDPRHVACDVRETTNWAMLAFSTAADELLREAEQGLDDDAPNNPPQK
ncbi:MAG: hypothetical protein J0M09_13310 [Xanthomonadales bacterium]|nr:hypothetical protein [Xanthomonadales bacterium]